MKNTFLTVTNDKKDNIHAIDLTFLLGLFYLGGSAVKERGVRYYTGFLFRLLEFSIYTDLDGFGSHINVGLRVAIFEITLKLTHWRKLY